VIVADASAVIEILLNTPLAGACRKLLLDPEEAVCVPHMLDVEVCQVLRRYVRSRQVTEQRAALALAEALDVSIVTCDARLGRSHGHRAVVRVVGP
jgi:predicted nucleic acid-binding protein